MQLPLVTLLLPYPSPCWLMQLLSWEFDWKYMLRGLVIDKKRGNILKVRG